MAIEDENLPVIEVAKSPSGEAPADVGITDSSEGAMMSTYAQKGTVQPDDATATREVVSAATLPLDYQYDEKQMMANVSTAISADIEDMTETELLADETFGYASKKMFRTVMGEDFTGTDEEATQFGIDLMRRVENNLVELGDFTHTVSNMKEDDAKIALYMMDMFEAKDFTGRGFAQALGYMGLDPTTYIGLGTFGFGFAGKEAAKQGTKQGIKQALQKIAFSPATIGAVEGGFYTGIFEHGKQVVSEAAGEGYDTGSVGLNVAIGGAAGGAAGKYLPEIFDYAGEKVAKWSAAKNFKAEVRAAADAGDADAIQVLADLELLDNHFDSDGFMRRKLDEFEQTRVGQMVTGVQRIADSDGHVVIEDAPAFYSQLEDAIKSSNQKTWNKQQLQGFLKKQGVKDEEIKWSGIQEYLDGLDANAKVNTQDLLDELNPPQLEKKILGEVNEDDVALWWNDEGGANQEVDFYDLSSSEKQNAIQEYADNVDFGGGTGSEVKYSKYKVEGIDGTNYREELTTLPKDFKDTKELKKVNARIDEINARMNEIQKMPRAEDKGIPHDMRDEWKKIWEEKDELVAIKSNLDGFRGTGYYSSHWDEANVLYHVRKQDTKIDGDDTLLIEEVQSDWHQEGRKKGYQTEKPMSLPEINEKIKTLEEKRKEITSDTEFYKDENKVNELQELGDEVAELSTLHSEYYSKVPQAPYSKTWHEKAMKDQIAEAVENGYDRVAWVAGKEQAERYDLSQQLNSIEAMKTKDGKWNLLIDPKHGGSEIDKYGLSDDELTDTVGKEMANQIIEKDGGFFDGEDLEIGGEGMKAFYDKMLPKWTNKYIKKFDSKVETKELPNGQEVWSFEVTDKMKKATKEKGQALYSVGAGVAAGAATNGDSLEGEENGNQ